MLQPNKNKKKKKFNNIVEKQNYWDSLVDKYGKGVNNRQIYIDLYNKPLKRKADTIKLHDRPYYSTEKVNFKNKELQQIQKDFSKNLKYMSEVEKYAEKIGDEDKGFYHPLRKQFSNEASNLYSQFVSHPSNKFIEEEYNTTWREVLNRNNIENKPLFISSLFDEGGDKFTLKNSSVLRGYGYFGLDTILDRADNLIKKKYLPENFKDRLKLDLETNEKGETVKSAIFKNLDDVVIAKKAIFDYSKDYINNYAKSLNINLSKKAQDYLTIVSYNAGESNAKKMLKKFKEEGLLENDKFLTEDFEGYSEIHRNVMRRIQAANMLEGENIIEPNKLAYGGYINQENNNTMNYTKTPKAFWGALISTGLNTGMALYQNAQEKKAQEKEKLRQNKILFGQKALNDEQIASNFDTQGNTMNDFYFKTGGVISPTMLAKGGELKKMSSNMEKAIGNKHEENNIDGTSGIKLYKNGEEQAEIENDEVVKDGKKVYSNRIGIGNNSFSKIVEMLDAEKQENELMLKKGVNKNKANSLLRKNEIIDMKQDKIFAMQENMKEQAGIENPTGTIEKGYYGMSFIPEAMNKFQNSMNIPKSNSFSNTMSSVVPYMDNVVNLIDTATKPKPTKPMLTPQVSYNTKVDITPQLNEIEQGVNRNADFIANNSSNSNSARSLRLMNRHKGSALKNQLTSQRDNQERNLENEAVAKNQQVDMYNNQLLNNYNDKLDLRNLSIRKELTTNAANAVDDTFKQKQYADQMDLSNRRLDLTHQAYNSDGVADRASFADDNSFVVKDIISNPNKAKEIFNGLIENKASASTIREFMQMLRRNNITLN